MAKQKQQQPEQPQQAGQKDTSSQQGGRSAQGQGGNPELKDQFGARQPDQSASRQSSAQSGNPGSQRGQTSNQFGSSNDDDDESPAMNEAGEQSADQGSSEKLRRGALDAQYGTDSSSKIGQQTNRPQSSSGSSGTGTSETSTGSDRDTMGGSRNKGR